MSDVTIIDTVETAEKNLGNKIDGLNGTIEGLPQEVQDQLNEFKATIDELKKNVEDTLAEVQETVENSPAGIMPPGMSYIKCASTDSGINVTYKPLLALLNDGTVHDYLYDSNIASRTKGVMVRYRTDTYPLDINDGILAFIDEDVTEFVTNKSIGAGSLAKTYGVIQSKEKTQLVTGLTQNQYYYFTAFPYSTNNVYLEAPARDMSNSTGISCIRCQWTGTKGTLTVNITQDYDYKPLGEYTATLTPTAGGSAVTKTQSGAATIVFSGLEAGEYTLSFSNVASFTKPSNQSVTVTAGQSQVLDLQYQFSISFSEASWEDIATFSENGVADKIFSIGDTKPVDFTDETIIFEIADFNKDRLVVGGQAGITLVSKDLSKDVHYIHSYVNQYIDFDKTDMFKTTLPSYFSKMDSSVKKHVKTVQKLIATPYSGDTTGKYVEMNLFIPSEYEMTASTMYSGYREGYKYSLYTTSPTRIKNKDGEPYPYYTRSHVKSRWQNYLLIDENGNPWYNEYNYFNSSFGLCLGFCI